MKIQNVALVGAGAVGGYFIWGLDNKKDINFSVIAKGERKKHLGEGLVINGEKYNPQVLTPEDGTFFMHHCPVVE